MPVDPVVTRRFIESLSTHLEDYLAAWKSSIADARREVDTILTSVGERIPAQAKPIFPEDIVGMLLDDMLPPPTPPQRIVEKVVEKVVERVEVPVPTAAADWGLVRGSLATIESARTQVDILSRFLTEANAHASRVALLVLRNDRLTGWKGAGFDATGGRDDAIKAFDLGVNDDPFVAEVLKRERTMFATPPAENSPLRKGLGGKPPAKTVLIPMVIRDRLAGLLVADELPGDDGRVNETALEILTFTTGLTVDLLAARKKIPSPTLTPAGETIARYGPPPPVVRTAPSAPAPAPAPAPPAPAPPAAFAPPPVVRPAAPAPAPPAPVYHPPAPAAPAPVYHPPAPAAPAPEPSAFMTQAASAIKLPMPEPRKTVAPLTDTSDASKLRKRLTDAGEALRALEESAGKKVAGAPDFEVPRVSRPESTGAIEVPRAQPRMAPPAPPAYAPPPTPPAGEVTVAFESLKSPAAVPPAPQRATPPPPLIPPPILPPRPAPVAAAPAPAPVHPVAPVHPPAPPAAAGGSADAMAGGTAAPLAPPPGFVPRRMMRQDDPRRAADDARRLARLLISEIKLYNEKKVEEGKAAGDVYERLKDDIERSRQVYNERVPENVRREADYFHEELIRILADGRADALGPIN